MSKVRLDKLMVNLGLVSTRSQAESFIKLGKVTVNGKSIIKPGEMINDDTSEVELIANEQYVSRAGLKLASVSDALGLNFNNKVVLDVGSSTGGFTDFALKKNAKKVLAVDVGTNQMHPTLRHDKRIELHEQTDIRNFFPEKSPDIIVIDVSFISLREILPYIHKISGNNTEIVAMLKPQFETGDSMKHKGVIKNDKIRRNILKEFETWIKDYFKLVNKSDSGVSGAKGNRERFYLLRKANQLYSHK